MLLLGMILNVQPITFICDTLGNFVSIVQFKKVKKTFGGVLLSVKLQISIILKSKLRNFHTCHQSSNKKEKTFGQLKCYLDTCLPRQTNKKLLQACLTS